MTCEEYREAITKNLEQIYDDWDMEKLYEYSTLLVSAGGKKKLAIAMLLNEQVTEKTASEIYYFLHGYFYG